MNAGGIQGIASAGDTHKACALLKCFRAQLCHLKKLPSACKAAVLFPVSYNIAGNGLTDTGDIFQKRSRCRIQINTYFIYTVLHHSGKSLAQLLLIHIMLILSHTDGFGVDFYQLSKGILKSSCDRSSTSLSHIKIGELLCCQLAGRINRRSSLIGDHILNLLRNFFQKLHDNLLRFSGCCSVSKRNQCYIVFFDQFLQRFLCRPDLCVSSRRRGINNCCIQNLAGGIYNGQLTAGTKSRVPSQNYLACDWRLHQKLLQIFSEDTDGTVFRLFCEITADLSFDGRSDKTSIAVLYHIRQNRCGDRILPGDRLLFQVS